MNSAAKKRYSVDLSAEMAECEANYARLRRLVDCTGPGRRLGLGGGQHLQLTVTERAPYTTTLTITEDEGALPRLATSLTVRMYHDARLAEVVECASLRRVQPRYDYPNPLMHQPDEKAQWNRFLGEWLSHCLQHGLAIEHSVPLS